MLTIRVLYFARAREVVGTSEEDLLLPKGALSFNTRTFGLRPKKQGTKKNIVQGPAARTLYKYWLRDILTCAQRF